MPFTYEAVDRHGKSVTNVVDATTPEDAMSQLHAQGLFVTHVTETTDVPMPRGIAKRTMWLAGRPGNTRDLLMFTQQMSMMLRAGSRVVQAIEAIEDQISKPGWRRIVAAVRQEVETGSSLHGAMRKYPEVFNHTFCAIVAAGESTGETGEAFDRLAVMMKEQQKMRTQIVSTLVYPAVLLLMATGVINVLMFFVLPRFDDLYTMLNTDLPTMTQVLIDLSRWIRNNVVIVVMLVALLIAVPVVVVRLPQTKRAFDAMVIRVPLIGGVTRMVILARIFRVWGASLRSNVPLLESLDLSQNVTTNALYRNLIGRVRTTVAEGGSIADVLYRDPLVPRTMAAALATGEQSGQLGEALLFLADYLDDENAQKMGALTRLAEPIILVLMGIIVGVVAISLFLPLFNLTSAAHG